MCKKICQTLTDNYNADHTNSSWLMVSLYPLHSICGALALVQRWWLWQQTSPSSPPPYSLWPTASPAQRDVWPREVMGPLGGEFGYKGGGGSSCSHRCSPSASSLFRTFTCAPIAPPPKYSFILMEGVGRWSEFFGNLFTQRYCGYITSPEMVQR